jgi:hypothetical protein
VGGDEHDANDHAGSRRQSCSFLESWGTALTKGCSLR